MPKWFLVSEVTPTAYYRNGKCKTLTTFWSYQNTYEYTCLVHFCHTALRHVFLIMKCHLHFTLNLHFFNMCMPFVLSSPFISVITTASFYHLWSYVWIIIGFCLLNLTMASGVIWIQGFASLMILQVFTQVWYWLWLVWKECSGMIV